MLTAQDIYIAWLEAYMAYRRAYQHVGIATPAPKSWEDSSDLDRETYHLTAELLNKKIQERQKTGEA